MIADFAVLAVSLVIAVGIMFVHRPAKTIPTTPRVQGRADEIRPDHPHFAPRRFIGTKAAGQCWYCSLPAPAETLALRVQLGLEGGIDAEGGRL